MILLIDNYDSFTYNLYQMIESLGARVRVCYNDRISLTEISEMKPDKIVISPGPRTPDYAGICVSVIRMFYQTLPILGVCLGHQCIGAAFGTDVLPARRLIHGQAAPVYYHPSRLFRNLPNPFPAARYHSLVINQVPEGFIQTGWDDSKDIMAIEHTRYPLFGVQFHLESFMTKHGRQIMQAFLNE